MQRRKFLASSLAGSLATSALAASEGARSFAASPRAAAPAGREYYLFRRYQLRSGPQVKLAHDFFRDAFIPAANRLGITPIGVFSPVIGPESPALYVLIPSASLETLVNLDARLGQDAAYAKAGTAFLNPPAASPAYIRLESSLMIAFEGQPTLVVPAATAEHRPRFFELRTYESPTDQDHVRKVEMFHSGEFDVFKRAGFSPVFYGDTLIGPRLPQLTYMLEFGDLADREKMWKAFGSDPQWKQLTSSPRFNFEDIVSDITNLILAPATYSQI